MSSMHIDEKCGVNKMIWYVWKFLIFTCFNLLFNINLVVYTNALDETILPKSIMCMQDVVHFVDKKLVLI